MPTAGLLEVGRITKAHGLGARSSSTCSTDRESASRRARCSTSPTRRPRRRRRRRPTRTVARRLRRRRRPREAAEALRGASCGAEPIDDPDALWVHELVGRRGRRRRRRRPGPGRGRAGQPGRRPAGARRRRPGAGRLRGRAERRAASSSTRPRACSTSTFGAGAVGSRAHRRLHDLPRPGRRLRRPEPARQGPAAAAARPARARPARPHHDHRRPPLRRRRAVRRRRRHGAACPSRCSPRSRPPTRPGRCSCSAPAAAASTRPWPPSWPRGDGFSLLCGRYEGVDERVAEHLVDGELSIGDYVLAGGEVAAMVVLEAVAGSCPG